MSLYLVCLAVSSAVLQLWCRRRRWSRHDPGLLDADGGAVLQEAARVCRNLYRLGQRARHRDHVHLHQVGHRRHRVAAGSAGGHGDRVYHVYPGHLLQKRLAVPSPAEGNSAPEEPEAEDQGQKQARRSSAVLRFQHAAE
uniref:(northern house mosquito) hypothetical protein n=1 Tax=Culex pipiens TaxID=7175 RepID=A0A8D8KFZ3_CULPI